MFTILIHSSKTMRLLPRENSTRLPRFIKEAKRLARYVASSDSETIAKVMKISSKLALATLKTMQEWTPNSGSAAIDTFIGDIYSGLQASSLSARDREYADKCLIILSGLYGILRPLDAVRPYRVEMAYKFPDPPFSNLYTYWGDSLAKAMPSDRTIINVSSVEYTKALFPYIPNSRVITPKFLTRSPKTGEPIFVTVHAKIARGAFARWLITERIENETSLSAFSDLGYRYSKELSSSDQPVYIAETFQGLGLSVRLS